MKIHVASESDSYAELKCENSGIFAVGRRHVSIAFSWHARMKSVNSKVVYFHADGVRRMADGAQAGDPFRYIVQSEILLQIITSFLFLMFTDSHIFLYFLFLFLPYKTLQNVVTSHSLGRGYSSWKTTSPLFVNLQVT